MSRDFFSTARAGHDVYSEGLPRVDSAQNAPQPECVFKLTTHDYAGALQVAFERGFSRGWLSAIETVNQIDWEDFKVGGTD